MFIFVSSPIEDISSFLLVNLLHVLSRRVLHYFSFILTFPFRLSSFITGFFVVPTFLITIHSCSQNYTVMARQNLMVSGKPLQPFIFSYNVEGEKSKKGKGFLLNHYVRMVYYILVPVVRVRYYRHKYRITFDQAWSVLMVRLHWKVLQQPLRH